MPRPEPDPELQIREGGEADAERIAGLHIESWRATYQHELSPAFLAAQDLTSRVAHWRQLLQRGIAVLLAERGASLCAFVACGPAHERESSPRPWEIYNLHVSPAQHRRGLGGLLFDRAVSLGRAQGAVETVLWVVESNRSARLFYERKGMSWDGGRQEHPVAPGEVLREVRYRISMREGGGT